jgi:broad specificity phosphatase PhoE
MGVTELWLVRHGESVANVAASSAEREHAEVIDVSYRDADVPLSETGVQQATALGGWLATHGASRSALTVWSSSYRRAEQTIAIALDEAGLPLDVHVDERLRDRELGVLDLLTSVGVASRFPEEQARRSRLGRFYYRPPGGESWADVALRLRSFLQDVDANSTGTVLVSAHDAVVMLFLYVCCGMTEEQLMQFARSHTVTNASVTRLTRPSGAGPWALEAFAETGHLDSSGAPVTGHGGEIEPEPA